MCGIAGWVDFAGREQDSSSLRPMLDALRHRGPDDEGQIALHGNGEAVLGAMGQRRLSIIDLSPAGRQPMLNEDGRLAMVCNGEIYNFRALRTSLSARGHCFRSQSDSEVILHGFEEQGVQVVQAFDGMFAFALWDGAEQELWLVRDRLGIKPLYYVQDGTRLAFASEIKALLALPWVTRRLDLRSLNQYLTYLYVPPPDTMWQGVKKLPPAHWLRFSRSGLTRQRYWDIPPYNEDARSEQELQQDLWELWEDVVRTEMVADVPVGVFLSGGLDSGGLVAAAARTGTVQTFTIGFQEAEYDETAPASEIAAYHNTQHLERRLQPDDLDLLDRLVWAFDEPMADSSAVANYRLSELASQHVKVALSGAGGDEVLGGYRHYVADQLGAYLNWVPAPGRHIIASLSRRWPAAQGHPNRFRQVQRFASVLDRSPEYRHYRYVNINHFEDIRKASLYADGLWEEARTEDPFSFTDEAFKAAPFPDFLRRALYADLFTYLSCDILTLTDRMSMAHGLEVRVPYVNRRMVEFLFRVPSRLKVRGLETKVLWRRSLRGHLPPSVLERQKQGFGVPVRHWFRGERGRTLEEIAASSPYFRSEAVAALFAEHRVGIEDHSARLWALVLFEHWRRAYNL